MPEKHQISSSTLSGYWRNDGPSASWTQWPAVHTLKTSTDPTLATYLLPTLPPIHVSYIHAACRMQMSAFQTPSVHPLSLKVASLSGGSLWRAAVDSLYNTSTRHDTVQRGHRGCYSPRTEGSCTEMQASKKPWK